MNYISQETAHQFVGKTLCSSRGLFHYYPLKISEKNGIYWVTDRMHTMWRVPTLAEGGLAYETVLED